MKKYTSLHEEIKIKYFQTKVPEIEILQWNLKDIITTSGDGLIDVNGLPTLDDEGWFDEFK